MRRFLLIVLLALTGTAFSGSKYYVSPTGHDGAAGRIGTPWLRLSKAASVLVAGDTLLIRGGTYYFANDFTRATFSTSGTAGAPITLMAYPGEHPTFNGQMTYPGYHDYGLIHITGNYIRLYGVEVDSSTAEGVSVTGKHCRVTRCAIHWTWQTALEGQGCDYALFDHCMVYDSNISNYHGHIEYNHRWHTGASGWGEAIEQSHCTGATMRADTCHTSWGEGICCAFATYGTVENCVSYDSYSVALYFHNSAHMTMKGNLVYQGLNMYQWDGYPHVNGISIGYETWGDPLPMIGDTIINNIAFNNIVNLYVDGTEKTDFLFANNTLINADTTRPCNDGIENRSNGANLYLNLSAANSPGCTFKNNIIQQNNLTHTPILFLAYGSCPPMSHNCWSSTPTTPGSGVGDVIADAKIVKTGDTTSGHLRRTYFSLQSSSPAIDAGTNVGSPYVGSAPDMGAMEYTPPAAKKGKRLPKR